MSLKDKIIEQARFMDEQVLARVQDVEAKLQTNANQSGLGAQPSFGLKAWQEAGKKFGVTGDGESTVGR